jgi:predicted dehydrogenase
MTSVAGDTIRLGLVRCDTHGYWYAPFFAECDPELLRKNDYPVYHYFYSDIFDPGKLRIPQVSGFDLVKVWDADPVRARDFAKTFLGKPQACDTLKEMTDGIDAVFIADCSGDGFDHVELASPFLEKGIPVYVDKPFASNLSDARTMIELAQKHGTNVMSASLLEYNPVAKRFREDFEQIAPVSLVVAKGVGGHGLAGTIHGIGLARCLLGDGVEWVEAMGHTPLTAGATPELNGSDFAEWSDGKGHVPLSYLHLHYKTGDEAIVLNTADDFFPEECWFYASAYSRKGALHSPPIGDPEFIGGGEVILNRFQEMVRTGKPGVAYESLLEKIAILDAARLAQKTGKPVYLKEMM